MKRFTMEHANLVFEAKEFSYEDYLQLMVDAGTKSLKGEVTPVEASNRIREVMFELLQLEEGADRKAIKKAMRRNHKVLNEVIEDLMPQLLRTGWGNDPFFNEWVEYKNAALGDTNEWVVEDDIILTVSEIASGNQHLIRQRLGANQSFGVKTGWYGVKVYAEMERFLAGLEDWAKLVAKVYEAVDKKVKEMIYAAFMAAPDAVMPSGRFTATVDFSSVATQHDAIIQLADDLAALTGHEIVMVGTKTALNKMRKLADMNYIANADKDDVRNLGRLAIWEGIRCVEIEQVFANNSVATTDRLVDNNKVLLMPAGADKFVKMYDEGEAIIIDNQDIGKNMDMTVDYTYMHKMGVATVINMKFGQIKFTA